MTINTQQRKALNLFRVSTRGFCDPWDLMGPGNASIRVEIMSGILGHPVPRAKAGVTALRSALQELLGISAEEGTLADRSERLAELVRAVLGIGP